MGNDKALAEILAAVWDEGYRAGALDTLDAIQGGATPLTGNPYRPDDPQRTIPDPAVQS